MNETVANVYKFIKKNIPNLVSENLFSFEFKLNIITKDIDSLDFNLLNNNSNVSFTFEFDGNTLDAESISEFKTSFGDTSKYLESNKNVVISIDIDKKILNENLNLKNVYFFSSYNYFKKEFGVTYKRSIKWEDKKKKLYFLMIDMNQEDSYSNDFISILPYDIHDRIEENSIPDEALKKYKALNLLNNNSMDNLFDYPKSWINQNGSSPSFLVDHSIIKLANIVSNNNTPDGQLLIKGYKDVYFDVSGKIAESTDDIKAETYTFNLVSFLTDEDKYNDKLLILRNVLTLYLNTESTINDYALKCKEISNTVTHNFELYIQDEIQVFLEQKNTLLKEVIKVTQQISDYTEEQNKQIRNIGISLLGTVFLGIASDLDPSFSNYSINIALFSYLIFFVINFIITFGQVTQFKTTIAMLKTYTETRAINNDEINFVSLKEAYIDAPAKTFKYSIWLTRLFLGLLMFVFFVVFLYFSFDLNVCPFLINLLKFLFL